MGYEPMIPQFKRVKTIKRMPMLIFIIILKENVTRTRFMNQESSVGK
jgi:hypothetical protein